MCLILFLWLLPSLGLAQSEWDTLRFDNKVSFPFPSQHEEFDSAGQKTFRAKTDFGSILAVRFADPQARIADSSALIDYYKSFEMATMKRNQGSASSSATIKVNDLLTHRFQFECYTNGSSELQQHMIFFIDPYMYSFTYACRSRERLLTRNETDRFFSSVTIYNTDFEDQLTVPNTNERIGELTGDIFRYIAIAAAVLVVILVFLKKYHKLTH